MFAISAHKLLLSPLSWLRSKLQRVDSGFCEEHNRNATARWGLLISRAECDIIPRLTDIQMSKGRFSWISLRNVTLALYWNYSDAGLSERGNQYHNELIDPSIHPIGGDAVDLGYAVTFKVRFPVSLSLMSQASASFTRFSFLFVSFNLLFFSYSPLGIYGTFETACARDNSLETREL